MCMEILNDNIRMDMHAANTNMGATTKSELTKTRKPKEYWLIFGTEKNTFALSIGNQLFAYQRGNGKSFEYTSRHYT